jgi:hypothetical protein
VDLHAVVVDLDRPAVAAPASDPPSRARHREVAGDGDVVGDDILVRLQVDSGGHGRPDRVGAARDRSAAMDMVDLHDRSLGMIESGIIEDGRCLDVPHKIFKAAIIRPYSQ